MKTTNYRYWAATVASKKKPDYKFNKGYIELAELKDFVSTAETQGHNMVSVAVLAERSSKAGNLGRDIFLDSWKGEERA